jgi:hypothetical protein
MPSTAFAARMSLPLEGLRQVCGLDYPFTLSRKVQSLEVS